MKFSYLFLVFSAFFISCTSSSNNFSQEESVIKESSMLESQSSQIDSLVNLSYVLIDEKNQYDETSYTGRNLIDSKGFKYYQGDKLPEFETYVFTLSSWEYKFNVTITCGDVEVLSINSSKASEYDMNVASGEFTSSGGDILITTKIDYTKEVINDSKLNFVFVDEKKIYQESDYDGNKLIDVNGKEYFDDELIPEKGKYYFDINSSKFEFNVRIICNESEVYYKDSTSNDNINNVSGSFNAIGGDITVIVSVFYPIDVDIDTNLVNLTIKVIDEYGEFGSSAIENRKLKGEDGTTYSSGNKIPEKGLYTFEMYSYELDFNLKITCGSAVIYNKYSAPLSTGAYGIKDRFTSIGGDIKITITLIY